MQPSRYGLKASRILQIHWIHAKLAQAILAASTESLTVPGRPSCRPLLLRPLLGEFGDRIINSTLAEGAVLGVCIGAALAGQRPIGEMQFNDFVATGFNQLVNNAAMTSSQNANMPVLPPTA